MSRGRLLGVGVGPGDPELVTVRAARRIGEADVTVRFLRDWLGDWRPVAANIERLIVKLRPPGA